MLHWTKTASCTVTLLFCSTVWADIPDFDELDVDANGYISEEEAQALSCLAEHFAHLETESAKGLNQTEFEAAVDQYCQRHDLS